MGDPVVFYSRTISGGLSLLYDFDAYNDGHIAGQDGWTSSASTSAHVGTGFGRTGKGMVCRNSTLGHDGKVGIHAVTPYTSGTMQIYARFTLTGGGAAPSALVGVTSDDEVWFQFGKDGSHAEGGPHGFNWSYNYNHEWFYSGVVATPNQWVKVEFVLYGDTNTMKIYADDILTANIAVAGGTTIDEVLGYGNEDHEVEVDDISQSTDVDHPVVFYSKAGADPIIFNTKA